MKNTHHFIRLHDRIDRGAYEKFKDRFMKINDNDVVTIHIRSYGGELLYAQKICDLILSRRNEIEIIGIAYGYVFSSALRILITCTYRIDYVGTKYQLHLPVMQDGLEEETLEIYKVQEQEVDFHACFLNKQKELMRQLFTQGAILNTEHARALGIINFGTLKTPLSKLILE